MSPRLLDFLAFTTLLEPLKIQDWKTRHQTWEMESVTSNINANVYGDVVIAIAIDEFDESALSEWRLLTFKPSQKNLSPFVITAISGLWTWVYFTLSWVENYSRVKSSTKYMRISLFVYFRQFFSLICDCYLWLPICREFAPIPHRVLPWTSLGDFRPQTHLLPCGILATPLTTFVYYYYYYST